MPYFREFHSPLFMVNPPDFLDQDKETKESYICPMKESKTNIEFNKNEDTMRMSLSHMQQKLEKIYEGGGKKAAAKQKEKNKLTPRERIDYLVDKGKTFIEIG